MNYPEQKKLSLQVFQEPRAKVFVFSHERSGTHFLMNALAQAFGYISNPQVDFDHSDANINFYYPLSIREYLAQFKGHPVANTFKSHHSFDFFSDLIEEVVEEFQVFYVYRNPLDVMVSLWRFIHKWEWHEGPKTDELADFIRMPPSGHMMRYQMYQQPTVLKRWESHVRGWVLEMPEQVRGRIIYVRFEDLLDRYAETLQGISHSMGREPFSLDKPGLEETVMPFQGRSGYRDDYYTAADLAYVEEQIGKTLVDLGYDTGA
ncbi:MAG: sulfotransferase domain-containing protein [Rhodospirillales bacterium]|nr:sulfotransferase domain-containing protein [Rhodospirillales bacterium]